MNQATAITLATETTTLSYYQDSGLPRHVETQDGQNTHFSYYPLNGASDKTPQVKGLIDALKLEDSAATSLSTAMALTCPVIPDGQPPLMAQYQYLKFPNGELSVATLILYGYAKATKNQEGVLTPDTVLQLEGVSVKTDTVPWEVTTASGRAGLSVSLQQIANTDSNNVRTTSTTQTTWYKDNNGRETRFVKETVTADPAAGTLHAKSETTLQLENTTLSPILSQHIRSARSGRVLRETRQDELGRPTHMLYHTYDASGRRLKSTESSYDAEAFLKGTVPMAAKTVETTVWTDDATGSWVRSNGPDGRCGRVLYDGLQRPVRWEIQRTAGDDHADGNYACVQEQTYGAEDEVLRQCMYDYLPGGLCLRNEGVALPENRRDWFWQADKATTSTDAQGDETLTTETLTGTMLKGPLRALESRQRNHQNGQVTLKQVHKRWNESAKTVSDTGLSTEEIVNTKGQRTRVTETLPANLKRQWDTTYDELGRRTQISAPDGSVTHWAYEGLSNTPTQIRVIAKNGEEKVLGQRTLRGQGDQVKALRVGATGSTLQYTFDDTGYVRPDNTRVYRVITDDGNTVSWYAKKTGSDATTPGVLLGEFKINAVSQAINTKRSATPDKLQGDITSTRLPPALLGVHRTDRTIRNTTYTQYRRQTLRGVVEDLQLPSGITSRAWTDTQNRRTRVRRGALEYRYRYGAQGECEHVTVQDMRTGRKQTVAYTHDEFGREQQRTYRLDDKVRSRYVQTWSVIGQLLSKAWYRDGQSTATRTENFEYYTTESSGRDELKSWSVTAVAGHYVLDTNGNAVTRQDYTYDVLGNLLTCASTFVGGAVETRIYAYEDAAQPTQRTSVSIINASGTVKTKLIYDANGNLTTNQQKHTLTYTSTGQLQTVSTSGNSALSAIYEYDELDRLAAQWDEANKQRRVLQYSDNQLCGELWEDAQGKTVKQRVLDEEAGLVVHLHEGQGTSATTETLFVMPDPQHGGGEEFSLDSKGEWQRRAVCFTPWGEAPLAGLNAMKSGLGYNGQRVDPITGGYHPGHGYRVYDPQHQAFYQGDSLSPFGAGGLNDRAYCAGRDPVNWHDPSGHIMMSRRDEAISLSSLDDMIRDTTPPYHEPAKWWEWALLGVFAVVGVIGAILTGGLLGVVMGILAVAAFGIGAASLALRQSNPALSQTLGWVSMGADLLGGAIGGIVKGVAAIGRGIRAGIQTLRNLRNGVKLYGVKSLYSSSRSGRYAVDFSAHTVKATGVSKIPVPVLRPIRNLINSRRPATPPASPGTSRAVVRRSQVITQDFGKFELIQRASDPSDTLYISAHGTNAIFGGKTLVPPGTQLNLYAPAGGTLAAVGDVSQGWGEWQAVKAITSGQTTPTKIVSGNHYTANYKLSHFEGNSKSHLETIVKNRTVDVIRIKPGEINDTSLNSIIQTLSENGHRYNTIEAGFCRASEVRLIISEALKRNLLPNRLI